MDDEAAQHEEQGHAQARQQIDGFGQRCAALEPHVVPADDEQDRHAAQTVERGEVAVVCCGAAVAHNGRFAHGGRSAAGTRQSGAATVGIFLLGWKPLWQNTATAA
jgi:hypothetical protein